MGGNGEKRKRRWAILRVFDFRLDRHLGGAAWYWIGTTFSLGKHILQLGIPLRFFLFLLKKTSFRAFFLSDLRGGIGILTPRLLLFCFVSGLCWCVGGFLLLWLLLLLPLLLLLGERDS